MRGCSRRPARERIGPGGLPFVVLLSVLAVTTPGVAQAPTETPTAWSHLVTAHAEPGVAGELATVAGVPVDEWRRLRHDLGLGERPIAESSLAPNALAAAIRVLLADGYLEAERALVTSGEAISTLELSRARRWNALLADAGDLDDADLRRRAAWTVFFDRGSAAAVLPAECFPGDREVVARLAELVDAETRLPEWRVASPRDAALSRTVDDELAPDMVGDAGPAFAASLAGAVATGVAPADIVTWGDLGPAADAACDPALARAVSSLPLLDRDAFRNATPGIRAVFATRTIPRALVRRAAVHRYLLTDAPSLRLLAEVAAETDSERALLLALEAGARGDSDAMTEALAAAGSGGPFADWVRAEAARQAGRLESAREGFDRVLAVDPFFAAALLGRASTFARANRADEALADLQHLRIIFPDDSVYAHWIDALDRRLR